MPFVKRCAYSLWRLITRTRNPFGTLLALAIDAGSTLTDGNPERDHRTTILRIALFGIGRKMSNQAQT